MCELLILGKFSNKFTYHLTRKGVLCSKYHGAAVIKFKNEDVANSFIDACHISDYLSETQIYKLCEVKTLENRLKNISKKIKVTKVTINT